MTQTATSPQRKPVLDEASFQQLLAAAYVLQEHNDSLRAKEVQPDFAKNLSAIVETQKLIQTLQLGLEDAAKLVAERAQQITSASGAAIGIIEKGQLVYHACTGSGSTDQGAKVGLESALSSECLSQGSVLSYHDAIANSHGRAKLFRERDVKSFVAVPVYHAGQVAGVLELRFARVNAFREADVRTAELMAGLLSEAMVTAARMKWKDALASERQSMLEALERIKPQLLQLGTEPSTAAVPTMSTPVEPPAQPKIETFATPAADTCSVCGSNFFDAAESFCGICGTARVEPSSTPEVPGKEMPAKTVPPWLTPYGTDAPSNGNSHSSLPSAPANQANAEAQASAFPASLQELIELSAAQQNPDITLEKFLEKYGNPQPGHEPGKTPSAPPPADRHTAPMSHDFVRHNFTPVTARSSASTADWTSPPDHFAPPVATEALTTVGAESLRIIPADPSARLDNLQPDPWGSARKTQQWLETVKGPRTEWLAHQWLTRRANIYIGVAILILVVIISEWGIKPNTTTMAGNSSPSLKAAQQAPPAPSLTMFEKLLVNLGLAEAPPAPVYMGNPNTQVWVDVHTALYHCPGSELYGKTPDGRMASQREAQQDQFEPANRKVCQ